MRCSLICPPNTGTFSYAAPELLMGPYWGAKCSPKVDSFSFGVVLHELISKEVHSRWRSAYVLVGRHPCSACRTPTLDVNSLLTAHACRHHSHAPLAREPPSLAFHPWLYSAARAGPPARDPAGRGAAGGAAAAGGLHQRRRGVSARRRADRQPAGRRGEATEMTGGLMPPRRAGRLHEGRQRPLTPLAA